MRSERVTAVRPARVRLMTIHQSKGLEFETVVLPDLERSLLGGSPPFLSRRRGPLAPVDLVCVAGRAETRRCSDALESMYLAYQGDEIREELSSFYVAVTRAKRYVHVIVAPKAPRGVKLSAACLLRDTFPPSGDTTIHLGGAEEMSQAGERPSAAQPLLIPTKTSLRCETSAPSTPSKPSMRKQRTPSQFVREVDEVSSKQAGEVLHEWLSHLKWLNQRGEWDLTLAQLPGSDGLDDARRATLWEKLQEALAQPEIRAALTCPEGRWEVHTELPYFRESKEGFVHGVIDRVAVQFRGESVSTIWVLDYKSAGIHAGVAVDANEIVRSYSGQIAEYLSAAKEIFSPTGKPKLRGGLVLLGAGLYRDL